MWTQAGETQAASLWVGGRGLGRIMKGKRDIKKVTETKEGGLQTRLCAQSGENQ